ncbi:unnamed protein product [Effrenium voratum]|uniref:Pentatricopeptide repeat-containing protein n=1 Tax=Effrenium voratum TaxID=2562239 RepID=A0AA36N0Y5_9DINO|nr:unnamed protein product [Effrenium voratum]
MVGLKRGLARSIWARGFSKSPVPREDEALLKNLDLHAEAGNIELAHKAFQKLLGNASARGGLHRMVWNTLLKAHANAGDPSGAANVYEEMGRNHVHPNRQTFGKLMESAAKSGNVLQAEAWFSELVNALYVGPRVVTQYAILLDACAKVGDIQRGELWLQKMCSAHHSPGVSCYTALINCCAVAGSPLQAEHWFDRMVAAGVSPNVISFNTVMDAFSKAGDTESAERWQTRMRRQGLQPTELTYSTLISSAARNSNKGEAAARL